MAFPLLRNKKPVMVNGVAAAAADFVIPESFTCSVNEGKRTLTIVGSDETRDRNGDVVMVNGWRLEEYRKNPVFLWAHDYGSVPIGRGENVRKRMNPKRLEFDIQFPPKEVFPFADLIFELYKTKFINACSVGFIPEEWEDLETGESCTLWGATNGLRFMKQILLELSGCPVPANPSALQDALRTAELPEATVKYLFPQEKIYKGFMDHLILPPDQMIPKDESAVRDALKVKALEIDVDKSSLIEGVGIDLETTPAPESKTEDPPETRSEVEVLRDEITELKGKINDIAEAAENMAKALTVMNSFMENITKEKEGSDPNVVANGTDEGATKVKGIPPEMVSLLLLRRRHFAKAPEGGTIFKTNA
jgi:hypothetical protein